MAGVDISGKHVLITGAASGIGRATAVAAGRRGARLHLTDLRAEALDAVAGEIRAAGGTVLTATAADVSDHDAVVALAAQIHAAHGSMDVVMNVAGISTWGSVDRLTHEHWRRLVDVNLMGPIHVIECFVPPMMAAGRGGHLVNVSSAAGLFGLPWHAAYSATKFGLRGVSEVLRFDLREHGIGVSLVCPGGVATPLVGTVDIVGVNREHPRIKRLVHHFERRAVTPEHAAACILAGVRKGRYMVYTSPDIRFGHFWAQRLPVAYELVMRTMNRTLSRQVAKARAEGMR
ncbi:SDR family oxidoreductase [Paraconexibacter antarcticus]|uniref:SDR family oxidoreductase n=1 Tax=Paraconexibacter antarcticus TaxID=2949664 RepID=A0ABY5DUW8_9ACTN|nr:SDR family oxidoreductase [Paraconexibacter antarcticus]UTI65374.1 SDR family oxidoreductase [Paraconexibacter antarcticus]